jgi:hypothetical protein
MRLEVNGTAWRSRTSETLLDFFPTPLIEPAGPAPLTARARLRHGRADRESCPRH